MKKQVSLVLKKRNKDTKKPQPIYVKYYYDRNTSPVLFATNQTSLVSKWDQDHQCIKVKDGIDEMINVAIKNKKNEIEEIVLNAVVQKVEPTPDYVKSVYEGGEQSVTASPTNLFPELEDYINSKERHVSKDVIKDYKSLRKHLRQFEKFRKQQITFEQLDYGFYKDFLDFLKFETKKPDGTKGLMTNTAGKQVKNLKAFLNDRMSRNIIPYMSLKGWKTEHEEVDSVYLNEKEIQAIEDLEFELGSEKDTIRDLFLISCETGLRYTDFRRLKRSSFNGDFLRVIPHKTRKKLTIPLSQRIRRVLAKYTGEIPNLRANDNARFNELIKEIVQEARIDELQLIVHHKGNQRIEEELPKYIMVSSHTGRRSFCTNQFLKGMPSLLIRRISGHKTERAFLKYIRIDEEEAAQMMLKAWKEN